MKGNRFSRCIKNNYIYCVIDGINIKGSTGIEPAIKNGAIVIVSETNYKNDNIIVMKTKEKNIKDIYGKMLNNLTKMIKQSSKEN